MINPAGYPTKQDSELPDKHTSKPTQLELIKEEHTKGKFFDTFINNFTDIGDAIRSNRSIIAHSRRTRRCSKLDIRLKFSRRTDLQEQISYFNPTNLNLIR